MLSPASVTGARRPKQEPCIQVAPGSEVIAIGDRPICAASVVLKVLHNAIRHCTRMSPSQCEQLGEKRQVRARV
jgi:hypothetical protein